MAQLELLLETQPRSAAPSPDAIRARLNAILNALRAADKLPWDESEARYWRIVAPQMANWLPPEERDAVRAEFAAELERLTA